jgi:hypothetical protein
MATSDFPGVGTTPPSGTAVLLGGGLPPSTSADYLGGEGGSFL